MRRETSSCGGLSTYMPSALIPSEHSYPTMPLARQLVYWRFVHPGPLVLRTAPLKFPAPASDRDRTVSRRSKPSSRTALIGEQPNPWDLLQPQDAMSRHRTEFHAFTWRRLYLHLAAGLSMNACVASLGVTRAGVLPRHGAEASPFGSVVTGSSVYRKVGRDFPRCCRVGNSARGAQNSQSHGRVHRYKPVVGAGSLLQHPDVLRCQTSPSM